MRFSVARKNTLYSTLSRFFLFLFFSFFFFLNFGEAEQPGPGIFFAMALADLLVGGPVLQWLKSCYTLRAFTAGSDNDDGGLVWPVCCCFPLLSFSMSPLHNFYVLSALFFSPFFPSCNLSPGFRSLGGAHAALYGRESFILEIERRHPASSRERGLLYRRVVKTAKRRESGSEGMENFSSPPSITSYCPSGPEFWRKKSESEPFFFSFFYERQRKRATKFLSCVNFRRFT